MLTPPPPKIYILQTDKSDSVRAFGSERMAIAALHEHLWDRGVDFCGDDEVEVQDDQDFYAVYAYGERIASMQRVNLE